MLDLDDPRNPFRGWSVLYVPSCTGDVYAGDAVRTYRDRGAPPVTVHHRGHVNATAALDWVFRRVPDPRRVFVTGCSAGSIGSILHAPRIIRQYPRAQVASSATPSATCSAGRPISELWGADRVLPDWVPGVRAIPRARFTMPRFYQAVAAHYPRASFAQVNFVEDAVQRRFHEAAGGAPDAFGRALGGNLAAIRAASPNFRSCLLEGSAHAPCPGRSSTRCPAAGSACATGWPPRPRAGRSPTSSGLSSGPGEGGAFLPVALRGSARVASSSRSPGVSSTRRRPGWPRAGRG